MNGNSAVSQEPAHAGMLQLSGIDLARQDWRGLWDTSGVAAAFSQKQGTKVSEAHVKFHPLGDKLAYVCSL